MSNLLKKVIKNLNDDRGVFIIQNINRHNTELQYIEMKVIDIKGTHTYWEELGGFEVCIIALTGKINVTSEELSFENIGTRKHIFEKNPTDSVYISGGKKFQITAIDDTRVALCYAPSTLNKETKVILAEDVLVESRGGENNKRLVHTILSDTDKIADSLLVVEVFTDSGNWSSYPPHKHDEDNMPEESLLEEVYYHEIEPKQGFVVQLVYTDDRSIHETETVNQSDIMVVPKGYHPVGVPAGYNSYYLNVMAGPKRVWQFKNDPVHEWIVEKL